MHSLFLYQPDVFTPNLLDVSTSDLLGVFTPAWFFHAFHCLVFRGYSPAWPA